MIDKLILVENIDHFAEGIGCLLAETNYYLLVEGIDCKVGYYYCFDCLYC